MDPILIILAFSILLTPRAVAGQGSAECVVETTSLPDGKYKNVLDHFQTGFTHK